MTRPMTVEELFAQSGGGAPIYFNKDSKIGDNVEGEVVDAKAREARDFENPSVIKTWDDGSPQWQLVVTLQTALRDRAIEDDDGKRRVFLRWYGSDKKAVEDAVARAGDTYVKNGSWMRVTYRGFGEQANPRLNPPKVYDVEYRAASSVERLMTKDAQSAPAASNDWPQMDAQVYAPASASAVSDARSVQQQAAQDVQANSGIGDRRALIAKATKLHQSGFSASEISTMVPLSLEAIEAILAI